VANVERLKRRLVRELVQENLDLIHGAFPRRRPRRSSLGIALRATALVLVPVALLGSTRLLSTFAPSNPVSAPAPLPLTTSPGPPAQAAARPPRPLAPAVGPGASALAFAPPQAPVDAAVFPLAVRRVVLDPGHGGESLGTRAPLGPQGLAEKDLTLDIARRVERLLEDDAFEVVLTRAGDHTVSLRERAELANQAKGDVFVSIHVNWIETRETRGVETYFVGPTDDPFVTRLAAAENRGSGYSLADLRPLLDRLYAGVRQDNSRRLAEVVQQSLYRSLGKVNPQLGDRGIKSAPFLVLLSTEMPAILAEVSCLSNEEEARLLNKPLYRQYIAKALADGVRSYADAVARAGEKGT
jgi:N-acetylmuramoyl-L-alanine amidase